MAETTSNAARLAAAPTHQRILRLPHVLAVTLVGLARRGYPYEVCGLLLGRVHDDAVEVVEVREARNLAAERRRDRFVLDPADWLAAEERAHDAALDIVGVWHTHPDHPARPSRTDLAAAWPELSYLILSVCAAGVTDITSWTLDGSRGDFVEQTVQEVAS